MTLGKHMRRGGIPLWGFSRSENDLQMLVKPPEVRTFPLGYSNTLGNTLFIPFKGSFIRIPQNTGNHPSLTKGHRPRSEKLSGKSSVKGCQTSIPQSQIVNSVREAMWFLRQEHPHIRTENGHFGKD